MASSPDGAGQGELGRVEHARRIERVDLGYPIILSAAGLVTDGMHRVAKAHLLGHQTIEAVRFEDDPEPDRVSTPEPGDDA